MQTEKGITSTGNHQGTWSLSSEQQKQLNFLYEGWSAAGLLWLLMVDGEVEEWNLRGTGVSTRRSPVRLSISLAKGTAANCKVTGQRDLDLKPYLSALRRHEDNSRSKKLLLCLKMKNQGFKFLNISPICLGHTGSHRCCPHVQPEPGGPLKPGLKDEVPMPLISGWLNMTSTLLLPH